VRVDSQGSAAQTLVAESNRTASIALRAFVIFTKNSGNGSEFYTRAAIGMDKKKHAGMPRVFSQKTGRPFTAFSGW
jgi:hypothetical protein